MAEDKFLDKSSGVMAGSLNMSNNKITHLATATANGDAHLGLESEVTNFRLTMLV